MPRGVYKRNSDMKTGKWKRDKSPSACAKRSEIQKEVQNRPDVAAKHSSSALKFHQEHPNHQKEVCTTPEAIANYQRAAKEVQNRPEVRAKQKTPHSREVRARIARAKIGPLNPSYIPDRSHTTTEDSYPLAFTDINNSIRERDGHRCRDCDKTQEEYSLKMKLDVHHIDLDRDNSDPDNLITLCRKCHCRYHPRGRKRK